MFCPGCSMLCDDDAVFCGNCGKQVVPVRAQGATVAEPIGNFRSYEVKRNMAYRNVAIPRRPIVHAPPVSRPSFPLPASRIAQTPAPARPEPISPSSSPINSTPISSSHSSHKYLIRNIFISVLIIMLVTGVSAGLIALVEKRGSDTASKGIVGNGNASGIVSFSDSQNEQGLSNTVSLKIGGLSIAPQGFHYYAWIVDTASEKTVPLGPLVAQNQKFNLTFTGKINLPGAGNQLEITQEKGNPLFPTGVVVLSGMLPPLAMIHIKHLLVKFDTTPGAIGLLVGLQKQAYILNEQAKLLKKVSANGPDSIACTAQNIVDVIEGKNGLHAHPLASMCTTLISANSGDGFGLMNPGDPNAGYIVLSAEHASLAATQSDATNIIRLHAQHVQIAMTNLTKWITTLDKDARQLVAHPNNTALIPVITTLADHTLNGVDSNDNGQIDPVLGEAGAIVAYNEGQMMAQFTLTVG